MNNSTFIRLTAPPPPLPPHQRLTPADSIPPTCAPEREL